MKKRVITLVLLACFMAAFSLHAFGQDQSAEDLTALNAELKQLYRQGKFTEAVPVAEKIRTLTERRYGPDHVETANAMNNLALLYIEKKQYAEAEKLAQQALTNYRNILTADHPCTAYILDNLAEIYQETGRFAIAEKTRKEATNIRKEARDQARSCSALEPLATMRGQTQPPTPPPADEIVAYWNTWFENRNDARVEVLETGKIYSFVLDISRFQYFKDYAAVVDPSVQGAIKAALERGEKKIRFTIRPILHGDLLRFAPNQPSSMLMEAEISKLTKPQNKNADNKMRLMNLDFLNGNIELRDFARAVQAGEVRFNVQTRKPGDTTISVSFWDESGLIPLDHLTLPVRVIDPGAAQMRGVPPRHTIPIKAGLNSMLDVSLDFSSNGALVADAAFYIFEPGPEGQSIVLFAARKAKAAIGTPGPMQGVSIYAWETESRLSQYIESRNQLIVKIRKARDRAASRHLYAYQEAADELRKKIFSGMHPNDKKQALEADRAFRDLVRQKDRPALVFVRMRNEKGLPVYVPLGILAARSEKPILAKRIVLVQPLPRERYPGSGHPVESWTYSIPCELNEVRHQHNDALKQLKTTSTRLYRDIPKVKSVLENIKPSDPDTRPEGLLFLAHHADGNLWFSDQDNRIVKEDIQHCFPVGSVAILAACSVAAAEGNNQAILEKLNNNGIDAMIISPFPIHADYGTMLAIHFVQALDAAKAGARRLSMADLFTTAAAETTAHFKKEIGWNVADMDLEFLIAGDYRIMVAPK